MSKNVKNSYFPKIHPTGKSMTRLRKKLNLSVSRFAQELNVSSSSIYCWEKTPGKLKLNDQTLYALARLYQQ
jgi:DNA-binding transcriptional regulator YiaG